MSEVRNISPAREKVKLMIQQMIGSGKLQPGNLVPGENQLARELEVARGTVRTALDELEEEGMLYKQSSRRYVSGQSAAEPAAGMKNFVLFLGKMESQLDEYRNSGFMLAVQAGILERLSELGKHVSSLQGSSLEPAELDMLLKLRPEGLILSQEFLLSERGPAVFSYLKRTGIPMVLGFTDGHYAGSSTVISDHEQGNYELTAYAISRNYRKILCFYPESAREYWFAARRQGYLRAMSEAGVAPMPALEGRPMRSELCYDRFTFDQSVRLYLGFLYEYIRKYGQPDCIFANGDWDVPILAEACRIMGIAPGQEIAFMGYDNKYMFNPWREFDDTRPAATLDKNNALTGRTIADLLQHLIESERPVQPESLKVHQTLIVVEDNTK